MRVALLGVFGAWLIRNWSRTLRLTRVGEWRRHPPKGVGPPVYAFWHGELFPLVYPFRDYHAVVLTSLSEDGEMISRILRRLGLGTVRGSSSRSGAEALEALERAMAQGLGVGLAVDGPKGPRREVKAGAVRLSRSARGRIIPVGVRARWAIRLGSWDRFVLPLPWSRVAVSFGVPLDAQGGRNAEALLRARAWVGEAIDREGEQAERVLARSDGLPGGGLALLYRFVARGLGLLLALPLLIHALVSPGGLRRLIERLGGAPRSIDAEPIWVHCASVGEVLAVGPFLAEIRRREPDAPLVLSTMTRTGIEVARKSYPDIARMFLFPLDLPGAARRALTRVRPRAVVLAETEVWPSFLREAERLGIPVGIVNGRLSDRSFRRYRWVRPLLAPRLSSLSFVCAQAEIDRDRFLALGASPETTWSTGNFKFDASSRALPRPPADLAAYLAGRRTFVAGSTHPGEEEAIVEAFEGLRRRFPGAFLVLAPRHPGRAGELERLLKGRGLGVVRRSALGEDGRGPGGASVLLLDTVGELGGLYALATVAFVGGSLVPHGGHNVLEPALAGRRVCFGPSVANFREAVEVLDELGAGVRVAGGADLAQAALEAFARPGSMRIAPQRVIAALRRRSGGVERTLERIAPILFRTPLPRRFPGAQARRSPGKTQR